MARELRSLFGLSCIDDAMPGGTSEQCRDAMVDNPELLKMTTFTSPQDAPARTSQPSAPAPRPAPEPEITNEPTAPRPW